MENAYVAKHVPLVRVYIVEMNGQTVAYCLKKIITWLLSHIIIQCMKILWDNKLHIHMSNRPVI